MNRKKKRGGRVKMVVKVLTRLESDLKKNIKLWAVEKVGPVDM